MEGGEQIYQYRLNITFKFRPQVETEREVMELSLSLKVKISYEIIYINGGKESKRIQVKYELL